jgi:hypothetical protein
MPAIGLGVAVLPPIYLLLGELTRRRFRRPRRRGGGACTRRAVEQTGRQHPRRGSVVTSSANHPPTKTTRSRRYTPTRFHPRTAVVNFASTLSGMAMGLRDVAAIDDTITAEAEELAASLASGVAQHPEADQDAAGRRGDTPPLSVSVTAGRIRQVRHLRQRFRDTGPCSRGVTTGSFRAITTPVRPTRHARAGQAVPPQADTRDGTALQLQRNETRGWQAKGTRQRHGTPSASSPAKQRRPSVALRGRGQLPATRASPGGGTAATTRRCPGWTHRPANRPGAEPGHPTAAQ